MVNVTSFSYCAYNSQGAKLDGQIEASDRASACALLHDQKLMVVSITVDRVKGESFVSLVRRKVNAQELEYLTSELALLLNSGVTIDRGLSVIRRNTTSAPQSALVAGLHDAVRRGNSLSEAMSDQGSVFSTLYINLVKLGESSGSLPEVFQRLAEDMRFQSTLKRKIIQSLTYPAVILAVCILCIVFIFNYIVPQMSGLFQGLPEVPVYTALLLGASEWMINYQWFLLVGIFGAIAAFIGVFKTPSGARYADEILLRIPGLNGVFILIERIRFNTAISMMLASGILIDRCLEMATGSVKNRTIRQGLVVAKEQVKKGDTLAKALGGSQLYPDFSISLIEVGEESGQLEPVFLELSSRARREFEGWVERFTTLLEPLLILFMGGIVGGVVVIMLLSIVSVNDVGI